MIKTAAKLGMKGLALTDHECLCGHLKWLQTAKKLKTSGAIPQDFKAALGNEIYLVDDRNAIERYWHYILIAKNADGHRALRELSSTAWLYSYTARGMTRVPTEKKELEEIIKKYPNSLIATTACIGGQLGGRVLQLIDAEKKGNPEEIFNCKSDIDEFIRWNIDLFGDDFYIEVAAGTSKDQIKFNQRVGMIAKAYNRKMVIGSDAHYLTAKERPLHKAYLNSKEGDREVDEFYFDAHMMDNEEAFKNLKVAFTEEEFKEMCKASMEIYDKIEEFSLERNPIIPEVEVEDYLSVEVNTSKYKVLESLKGSENVQERYWVNECLRALSEKDLVNDKYLERLEIEADIINTVGNKLGDCLFKYFNTFQHYINLFWKCGSIVGPGRGSSVCFLSNYLLGITQLDPLVWGLPEWRFLNKERVELPDIDIDLSPSKRKRIFEAIRQERGELNLVQVCTFGTEGTRSAIAAAGRGYRSEQFPNGLEVETTQYLSGLIPQERGFLWSIDDVVYGNPEKGRLPIQAFIDEVNKYPGLLEIIQSIEGLVNKRGQHASGVMMYNTSPYETNALMRSPNGDLTTQFELHDSDLMGDVKYDFLVTEICDKITTCIELMQKDNVMPADKNLRQIYDEFLHPAKLNLEDKRLWDSLSKGEVLDVFQFSTGVGLATAKQVKPQNPAELTSANALMRLMGEKGKERPLDRYCRLKSNINLWYNECRNRGLSEEEIKILEPYYLPNYGVPASQEDLMMVCMDKNIAHFTLKEANSARKTVAKKHMEEIPILKEKFVSQCPNRNFGEYVWETTMGPQMG
jgi:DNA polymerase-3 subunit alpha